MFRYKMRCEVSPNNDSNEWTEVAVEAVHPDACKQKISELYPCFFIRKIHIENLTPKPKLWNPEHNPAKIGMEVRNDGHR